MTDVAGGSLSVPLPLIAGLGVLAWAGAGLTGVLVAVPLFFGLLLLSWRCLPVALRDRGAPATCGFLALLPMLLPTIDGTRLRHALPAAIIAVAVAMVMDRVWHSGRVWAVLAPLCSLALLIPARAQFIDQGRIEGGYSIPWHRPVLLGLAFGGAVAAWFAMPRQSARPARRRLLWIGLPILTLGLSFHYRVQATAVDPLVEGQPLATAEAFSHGRWPGSGLRLVNGFGEDLVRPLLAHAAFGHSLRGLRVWDDIAAPLDAAVLTLLGVAILPARWAVLHCLALVCLAVPTATGSRFLLADAALMLLALGISRGRRRLVWIGGAVAVAALVWSPVTGRAAVAAAVAALLIAGGRMERGVLAGSVVASVMVLAGWLRGCDGLVASLALVVGAVVVMMRVRAGDGGRVSRLLALLWVATAFEPCDPARWSFLLLFAIAASLPRLEAVFASVALALLLVPGTGVPTVLDLVRDVGSRQKIDITDTTLVDRERIGVLLPLSQGRRLSAVLAVLDGVPEGETFYDFTNHAALYFLAARPPASALSAVALATTRSAEEAVVADLERHPPSVVLFRSNTTFDSTSGLDNRARFPIVAEHLVREFRPRASVGGFLLLAPGETMQTLPPEGAVYDRLALGSSALDPGLTAVDDSRFSIAFETTGDGGARLAVSALERQRIRALLLEFEASEPRVATLLWRASGVDHLVGVTFDVHPGRHAYRLPVSAHPAWVWPDRVEEIELRLGGEWPAALSVAAIAGR